MKTKPIVVSGAAMPRKLDDAESASGARAIPLPIDVVMDRMTKAIWSWDVERTAIRSVVKHHATVDVDVSRYTTVSVRFDAIPAPEDDYRTVSTQLHVTQVIRGTNWGLARHILLCNLLVGIPYALILRAKERALANEVVQSLVSHVLVGVGLS